MTSNAGTCYPVADEDLLCVLYVRLLAGKYRPPKIQILLTKCDLVKRIDLARRVVMVRQQLDEVRQACFFLFVLLCRNGQTGSDMCSVLLRCSSMALHCPVCGGQELLSLRTSY